MEGRVQDLSDIIFSTSVIVTDRCRHRHVISVPNIGEMEDRADEPDPEDETDKDVRNSPERSHQRRQ